MNWRGLLETLTITLAALVTSLVLFGLFMLGLSKGVVADRPVPTPSTTAASATAGSS